MDAKKPWWKHRVSYFLLFVVTEGRLWLQSSCRLTTCKVKLKEQNSKKKPISHRLSHLKRNFMYWPLSLRHFFSLPEHYQQIQSVTAPQLWVGVHIPNDMMWILMWSEHYEWNTCWVLCSLWLPIKEKIVKIMLGSYLVTTVHSSLCMREHKWWVTVR